MSTYGIAPEANKVLPENTSSNFELLERVKACAGRILSDAQVENTVDIDTIAAALDAKTIIPKQEPKPLNLLNEASVVQKQSTSVEGVFKSTAVSEKENNPPQTSKLVVKKTSAQKASQKSELPE